MAAVVAAVILSLSLAGCGDRTGAAVEPPAPASSPPSSPSSSPESLGALDATLARVDGAVSQSQQDLDAGNASAAKDDNG